MDIDVLLSIKTFLVGGVLLVFVLYERLRPAADSPLLLRFGHATREAWRRLVRNTSLFGLNLLVSPLIVIPVTAWADGFDLGIRPAWWSGWSGVALDILILDLWIYWWHRANHEIPLLCAFTRSITSTRCSIPPRACAFTSARWRCPPACARS